MTRNFPTDYFIPSDLQVHAGAIQNVLSHLLTEARLARFKSVAKSRTRAIMPVFESTHHCHNISAVLRTADAFGFQDVSFVYNQQNMKFRTHDSVERGSSSWLTARRTTSIASCAQVLKASMYKIFLVSLPTFARTADHYNDSLPSFSSQQIGSDLFNQVVGSNRIALVSGNEKLGLSQEWAPYADGYLHVDMNGFVESLNVSVCSGILLHDLKTRWLGRVRSSELLYHEKRLLIDHWISKSVPNARQVVERTHPRLLTWFDFVRSGDFYRPFDGQN
jgi:tRNA (guanosine-2'-O-)-methyltransferase